MDNSLNTRGLGVPPGLLRRIEERAKRKPTALATSNGQLVVLCNDGSLWELAQGDWIQIKPIPQPETR